MKYHAYLLGAATLVASQLHAAELTVELQNLTGGIYFTPLLITAHPDGTQLFEVGAMASAEPQSMAEGGDIAPLAAMADSLSADSVANPAGGLLGPTATTSATLSTADENVRLSLATMLVNTNDGSTGSTGYDLSALEVGDSASMSVMVYDAGTEANTEAAGTIPGPADDGEGASAGREELDKVFVHAGVVSQDDGLISTENW